MVLGAYTMFTSRHSVCGDLNADQINLQRFYRKQRQNGSQRPKSCYADYDITKCSDVIDCNDVIDSTNDVIDGNNDDEKRHKITINVSGQRFQTYVETLDRFPRTLLGDSSRREKYYDSAENEYFFDRDRSAFNAILYYYQSNGHLYCPITVPITILVTEAKFFDLPRETLHEVLDLEPEVQLDEMPKNKWQNRTAFRGGAKVY